MKKKIAIVDFGLGNLFSVLQACLELGAQAEITTDPEKVKNAQGVILPGVGAFGDAITNLRKSGMDHVLKEAFDQGKPIMGICLGLQLMFQTSEEFGSHEGLGFIKGTVKRFPSVTMTGTKIRVPQIGWNQIVTPNKKLWDSSPLSSLMPEEFMYFVHSYYVLPEDSSVIVSTTEYGSFKYCSGIKKNNLFAVQFHPEKSAEKGLEIYKNWLNTIQ
jgi:glutamine amidotransferase